MGATKRDMSDVAPSVSYLTGLQISSLVSTEGSQRHGEKEIMGYYTFNVGLRVGEMGQHYRYSEEILFWGASIYDASYLDVLLPIFLCCPTFQNKA